MTWLTTVVIAEVVKVFVEGVTMQEQAELMRLAANVARAAGRVRFALAALWVFEVGVGAVTVVRLRSISLQAFAQQVVLLTLQR